MFLLTVLVLGFAFLYIPILSVIAYSFNESRLVTVWGGFSTKWYGVLFDDRQMLEGVWLSLRIAAVTATGAVIIGTLAGLVLARFGKFRGRTTLAGMVTAPLVMPEVITGLSLLLLFVAFAPLPFVPDQRGFSTIAIAHITLTHVVRHGGGAVPPFDDGRVAGRGGHGSGRASGESVPGDHAADHCARDRFGVAAGVHAVAG